MAAVKVKVLIVTRKAREVKEKTTTKTTIATKNFL